MQCEILPRRDHPASWDKNCSKNPGRSSGFPPIPGAVPRIAPRIGFSHGLGRESKSKSRCENTPEILRVARRKPFSSERFGGGEWFLCFRDKGSITDGEIANVLTWKWYLEMVRIFSPKRAMSEHLGTVEYKIAIAYAHAWNSSIHGGIPQQGHDAQKHTLSGPNVNLPNGTYSMRLLPNPHRPSSRDKINWTGLSPFGLVQQE